MHRFIIEVSSQENFNHWPTVWDKWSISYNLVNVIWIIAFNVAQAVMDGFAWVFQGKVIVEIVAGWRGAFSKKQTSVPAAVSLYNIDYNNSFHKQWSQEI